MATLCRGEFRGAMAGPGLFRRRIIAKRDYQSGDAGDTRLTEQVKARREQEEQMELEGFFKRRTNSKSVLRRRSEMIELERKYGHCIQDIVLIQRYY